MRTEIRQLLNCASDIDEMRRNLTALEFELMEGETTDPQRVAILCQQIGNNLASIEGKTFNDIGLYSGEANNFQPLHAD